MRAEATTTTRIVDELGELRLNGSQAFIKGPDPFMKVPDPPGAIARRGVLVLSGPETSRARSRRDLSRVRAWE